MRLVTLRVPVTDETRVSLCACDVSAKLYEAATASGTRELCVCARRQCVTYGGGGAAARRRWTEQRYRSPWTGPVRSGRVVDWIVRIGPSGLGIKVDQAKEGVEWGIVAGRRGAGAGRKGD